MLLSLLASVLLAAAADEPPPLYRDPDQPVEARVTDLLRTLTLEEKAALLNHDGPDVARVGLRGDKWNQCLHGVCWDRPTTMFPVPIALAATWDADLVHTVASTISDEARAVYNLWHLEPTLKAQHKGLIYRAPVINVGRNPYWGRNNECWGEDPYLTGRLGAAFVKGMQGDDPHYLKLVSTLKHFAVNNVEHGRQSLSAAVSERMLFEYWLPHFHDCVVEGGALSVMASYNAINGTPNNINHYLLTDILKEQWGFQGFVVSDLGGVGTMVAGHEQGKMSLDEAVAKSLLAGCDFSDREFQQHIPSAVRAGLLPESRVDDALRRVLTARLRLGELDPPERVPYSKIDPAVIDCAEHRALARRAAREAMVLLSNRDGLLPLDRAKLKTVAVIGPHADHFTAGGYSGQVRNPVTPLAGIRGHVAAATNVVYALGGHITAPKPPYDAPAELAKAVDAARSADVAIVCVGTTLDIEAEGRDRTTLALPGNQQALVEAVVAANPRTVVVLLNAGPLTVPWIAAHAGAVVAAWWAGEEGGNALADVLFGDANPAGRLPYTVYADEQQVPPRDDYDISDGFTYQYLRGAPLYAFGHGLSYTTFGYGELTIAPGKMPADGAATVTLDIENTGGREGDEVVQLYVHQRAPRVKRARLELRGFTRVHLAPGEKRTVSFTLPAAKLGCYDERVHRFVTDAGVYDVMVGAASDDIRRRGVLEVG
jgi:beta-glucosidase